ncbi:MAG: N-acetyltransferase [Paracoccaceae bacterium]
MAAFKIIPAPLALKDEIKDLSRQTFKEHRARQPWTFAENTFDLIISDVFDSLFRDGKKTRQESPNLLVAMSQDQFAGYVLLMPNIPADFEESANATIFDICVRPEFRGQGAARALLDHVIALSQQQDWDNLDAQVWVGNVGSDRLFQSAGFTPQSTTYRIGPNRKARDIRLRDIQPPPSPSRWTWLITWWPALIAIPVVFILATFKTWR